MDEDLKRSVQRLLDRQAINDCLLRYTRGIDRLDEELARSAYHPDATDDHGIVTLGIDEFLKFVIPQQRDNYDSFIHLISNVNIDFDSDISAHVECYYIFLAETKGPGILGYGRYIDHFEKRDEWRVANRCVVSDGSYTLTPLQNTPEMMAELKSSGPNTRDRNDVSYMRPLKVRAPRPIPFLG